MLDKFLNMEVDVPYFEGKWIISGFTKTDNNMDIAQLKRNLADERTMPINFKILKKDGKFLEELLDKS